MKKLLLAAAAVLALTGAARGEVKIVGHHGDWTLFQDENTCSLGKTFGDTTFILQMDSHGGGGLGVARDGWVIPKGQYPVTMSMDSSPKSAVSFISVGRNSLSVPLQWSEGLFKVFAEARLLFLEAGSETITVGLTGTAIALPMLARCAADLARTANPFAGQPQAQPAPAAAANPFKRT